MRITYIHQYYRTPRMSGGTRSYEFARRLAARGHTVDVVTSAPAAGLPPDATPDPRRPGWRTTHQEGVTVHWCVVEYSHRLGFAGRLRAFVAFVLRASVRVPRLPADVVFATSTPLTVAVPAMIAAAWRRVPMVFEVRDVWPEVPIAMGYLRNPVLRGAARALEWLAYRRSAHVIALSPDMARSIARRHPRVRPSVIPNSSDLGLFAAPEGAGAAVRATRPEIGDRPLVVYTGTVGPANGVEYIVDMAAEMLRIAPEVRFLIVGDGKDTEHVRAAAERHGVLGRTLFLEPPVAKQDVPALLAAADMTLSVFAPVPALAANSPNKVFDSFAAGRPVMINNGGWLGEVLVESGAGLVAPPDRPDDAARSVRDLLADQNRMAAARDAARRLATERFDRDLLADSLEERLLQACGRSDSRRVGAVGE